MSTNITMDLVIRPDNTVRSDDPDGSAPASFNPAGGFTLSGSPVHGGKIVVDRPIGGFGSSGQVVLYDDFASGNDGDTQSVIPKIGKPWDAALGTIRDRAGMPQGRCLALMEAGVSTISRYNWTPDLEVFFSCVIDFDADTGWDNGKPIWLAYDQDAFTESDATDSVLLQILTAVQNYNIASNVVAGAQDTGNPKWDVVDDAQKLAVRFWGKSSAPQDGFLRVGNATQGLALDRSYPNDLTTGDWLAGTIAGRQGWGALNLVGFTSLPGLANLYISDVLVQKGPNACARIELADTNNLTTATKTSACPDLARSATQVQTIVRAGLFTPGETVHIHVMQGDDSSLYAGSMVLQ